jgi:hypothetical protein
MTVAHVSIVPVTKYQYFVALAHLSTCWGKGQVQELSWFLASMRGELPPARPAELKNYTIHYVQLPREQYLAALEALTTRLGVKLP